MLPATVHLGLDVFLVPQRENADVQGAVEAILRGLHCAVSSPYLGAWNRLSCIIRPRTESMVAAAVQWAERIMRKIDGVFGKE